MPRPKRGRGGRVTPKGTRPGDSLIQSPVEEPPLAELVLQGAAAAADCADLDSAEAWASSTQIFFRPLGFNNFPVLHPSRMLDAAEVCDDRAAAAMVAAAMGIYGPPGCRPRASGLLERLAEEGAPLPGCARGLGDVKPCRATLLTDSWDDGRAVWIDYERPDGELRGVGVGVGANVAQGAFASHFAYGPGLEAVVRPFADQPHTVLREISLADARAMVETALELRDMTDIDYEDEGNRSDDEMRALVEQRIALLPGGGDVRQPQWLTDEEIDGLCAEFLALTDERLPESAAAVAGTICHFASAWADGDPLCWSPRRVKLLLSVWIPTKSVPNDRWHDTVESVVPCWLRFAAERRGLAEDLLELNLHAARDAFGDMRANAADPTKRSRTTNIVTEMHADGIDLGDDAAVQEWIERYNARPRHERY